MKKIILTGALTSVLLLAACSSEEPKEEMKAQEKEETTEVVEETETEKVAAEEVEPKEEEKNTGPKKLKNGEFEIEMAKVKITNTEILPPDEFDEASKDRLVITYEVTSKVEPGSNGDAEVTAWGIEMAAFNLTQENETSVVTLNHGFTPEEYFSYQDTEMNVIKKGATVEDVAIYELDNRDYPVILTATAGLMGEELGLVEIDVSK